MDAPPSAPPVVAVVLTRDPGPCFEDVLRALGAQDYPNLTVLVVDSGSRIDPAARVAATLPSAYVRRVEGRSGFAGAANDVHDIVSGAAFLLFCQDSVAPEPSAVRRLVEEAFRSNAGIVGPKIVAWDDPRRLLDVGLSVDKTGASAHLAERGELDQEQHDGVRDVFAVSSTCMLVRGDLFEVIGGFDPTMGDDGADVDICWRAQVAGARVLVAPAARVRHQEDPDGPEADARRSVILHRNHLRSMFKNYSVPHLLRVAPQAAVLTLGEIVFALVKRQIADARDLIFAWLWNIRALPRLRPARRSIASSRAVPDSDVRRLQAHGSVRVTTYLQRRLRPEDRAQALVSAGQQLVGSVGNGPARAAAALAAVVAVVWMVGMRDLLTGALPSVGELSPMPGPTTLLAHWISGWRPTGLGVAGAAPTAFGWLGLSGIVTLGNADLLQKLLVLGAWPVAGFGLWRLTARFDSTLSRLVAVVVYAAVPLSYNALARGRVSALVVYAALPWLLASLLRATGLEPFEAGAGTARGARWRSLVVGAGLTLALAASLAPVLAIVLLVTMVALAFGSLLAGGVLGSLRGLGAAATATVVAAVLLAPWAVELLFPAGGWTTVVGVAPDTLLAPSFAELLRFQTGDLGAAPIGWAFLASAALPLAFGRGWRLAWAIRLWAVVVVCVPLAWAGAHGWVPLRLESPDALLVPAALALAMCAGLGAATFEVDLAAYRFGWRQVASVAAGIAVVAGVIPLFAGARDGRFGLTSQEAVRSLSWMGPTAADGSFRVLWIGAAEALPVDGWELGDGIAYATSRNGVPTMVDQLPGRLSGATSSIADALAVAVDGNTAQLGHLLAPMGVRYVVLPVRLSTGLDGPADYPIPEDLTQALESQLDLEVRPSDPALTVYENEAWGPVRALLAGPAPVGAEGAADRGGAGRDVPDLVGADLSGATGVLHAGRANLYRGPIGSAGQVFVSEGPSGRWELTVDGQAATREPAFGVANVFEVERAGPGRLRFRTPVFYSVMLAVQAALWLLALRAVIRRRRWESRRLRAATQSPPLATARASSPAKATAR